MPNTTVRYDCLDGRGVIITGGASGIGAAMVEAFAGQGARIAFLDVDTASAEALVARLGQQVSFFPCDVTDVPRLRTVLKDMEAALGGVDVLVNNAARDDRHAIDTVEPESWRRTLALNLDHQFFATQAIAAGMAARGGGSVILFGSISWMRARPGMVGYTASKAAINGMTRTLARELGDKGIRVNCIVPGAIRTERQARLWRTPEGDAQILDLQALKFSLGAEHVAPMALFLASSQSAGCTGANFIVDAGLTLN
jgi:NAD(P)-dependent dehydrogenase (short-subunit alcohol dehydrogenase family)